MKRGPTGSEGFGVTGITGDRFGVVSYRKVVLPAPSIKKAAIMVRFRILWIETHGLVQI